MQSYASGAQGWIFRPRHHRRGASPSCREGFASSCLIFSLTAGEALRAPREGWILRLGLLAPRALGDSRYNGMNLHPFLFLGCSPSMYPHPYCNMISVLQLTIRRQLTFHQISVVHQFDAGFSVFLACSVSKELWRYNREVHARLDTYLQLKTQPGDHGQELDAARQGATSS